MVKILVPVESKIDRLVLVDGSISSAASVYRRVVVAPVAVVVVVAVGVFWAFYAPLRCPLILICLGERREDEQSEEDSPNKIERSTTKKIK